MRNEYCTSYGVAHCYFKYTENSQTFCARESFVTVTGHWSLLDTPFFNTDISYLI
jgi:hypothetical protein